LENALRVERNVESKIIGKEKIIHIDHSYREWKPQNNHSEKKENKSNGKKNKEIRK
jgi:hypothetical protein